MNRRRIALLGGSSAFTPALAGALAEAAPALPELELRLFGRDAARTAAVARFCGIHAASRGAPHHYAATTELDDALRGADFVVCQVRVGGFRGRSHDETFPLRFGLPGDETIGPGGLASAIRSLPELVRLARRAQQLAPEAPFVQLSNPLGIALYALAELPGLRAFGLCELPERTLRRACVLLDLDPTHVSASYVGVNHQGFFVSLRDADGTERLPELLEQIAALDAPGAFEVDGSAMRARGALLLTYARHYEQTTAVVQQMRARRVDRGAQLARLAADLHAHYAATTEPALPPALRQRGTPWNELALVPAIAALCDREPRRLAVSERNRGHAPGLRSDAIVEKWGVQVPGLVPPPPLADLDPGEPRIARILRFLQQLCTYERLAAQAALAPSEAAVLACLRAHPLGIPPGIDERALAGAVLGQPAAEATTSGRTR